MLAGAQPGARGCLAAFWRSQVRGESTPAAFSFSSIHLLTSSARLSRFSCALAFSVRIQHSRAARECVIGSEFATGALGTSLAVGPVASVSQPASASAQAINSTTRAAKRLRNFTTTDCIACFLKNRFLLMVAPGGGGYLPEKIDIRNGIKRGLTIACVTVNRR